MTALTQFLRWLVEYSVSGGFWHFVAVWLIVLAIARFTTVVSFSYKNEVAKSKDEPRA